MPSTFHDLPADASAMVLDLEEDGFSMREKSCLVRSEYAPSVERTRDDVGGSVEDVPALDVEATADAGMTVWISSVRRSMCASIGS